MSISRIAVGLALTCSIALQSEAQAPRPDVECGCTKTEAYMLPKLKQISWNAGSSPGGTYTAEPWDGRLGVVIRKGAKQ